MDSLAPGCGRRDGQPGRFYIGCAVDLAAATELQHEEEVLLIDATPLLVKSVEAIDIVSGGVSKKVWKIVASVDWRALCEYFRIFDNEIVVV